MQPETPEQSNSTMPKKAKIQMIIFTTIRQKFSKNPWRFSLYVLFALALLLQLNLWWYRSSAKSVETANRDGAALMFDFKSAIDNLPSPKGIKPGQTSGNGAGIITKYETTATKLDSKALYSLPIYKRLAISDYEKYISARNKAIETTTKAQNDVNKLTETTKTALKFIEYNPEADLATFSVTDPTSESKERLKRTKDGFTDTAKKLRVINTSTSNEMAEVIEDLLPEIDKLASSGDVSRWTKEVLESQNKALVSLYNNYNDLHQAYLNDFQTHADSFIHNTEN